MAPDAASISAAYDALDAAFETVAALSYDAIDIKDTLGRLDRLEHLRRRLPTTEHQLLAHAQTRTTPKDIGAKSWADVLAIRLRISTTEATRRVKEAEDLGPRTALTGQPLPPRLPDTAAAQARGDINAEHVTIIRTCLKDAARFIDATTREEIDQDLARIAAGNSPEALRDAAKLLVYLFNQDGDAPNDEHRARRRNVSLGRQDADGMTPISGWLDPELAATIQALFAKLAAPGMCNPNDDTPCINGQPDDDTIHADARSIGQRQHDALTAICRNTLSSGELGQHNGLPVTVIVSTTLQDLQAAAGVAVTGSGSLLPMSDVIRMASHSHHYLVIYDKHTREPLYLGRTKRIATAGQRLVLFNRGLACGPDNRLVKEGGWTTRIRSDGRIEWIPPPLLDTGQDRVNHYHHPDELLSPRDEDPPAA
ncbi:MAG: hypothetical protein QOG79_5298 [Mycobacterium sp.]|nr:hypothetical protein [Mycobacterium sp.]